jgi:transcriptional regulator with XRE-family HTH domain
VTRFTLKAGSRFFSSRRPYQGLGWTFSGGITVDEQAELAWGLLVWTLRTLLGWSQEELATAAGVHARTIGRHENDTAEPTQESRRTVRSVESALGIEGRTGELRLYLGPLRDRMLGIKRRTEVSPGKQAATAASRLMRAALSLGIEDLRTRGEADIGLPWGRLIATLRTLRGWTQEELAEAADVDPTTISRQELDSAEPSRIVREKLEGALSITGETKELQILLGGIRAQMLAPKHGPASLRIEEAAALSARFTEAMLRLALDESLQVGEEPEARPPVPPVGEMN